MANGICDEIKSCVEMYNRDVTWCAEQTISTDCYFCQSDILNACMGNKKKITHRKILIFLIMAYRKLPPQGHRLFLSRKHWPAF